MGNAIVIVIVRCFVYYLYKKNEQTEMSAREA